MVRVVVGDAGAAWLEREDFMMRGPVWRKIPAARTPNVQRAQMETWMWTTAHGEDPAAIGLRCVNGRWKRAL